ncbi:MAG TPA: rhamnogalacturonan acetylesterase [Opitutaceae bacterium]|nr:rhamnogalacturonan acetylesterase [Opitutaceae bacterium]
MQPHPSSRATGLAFASAFAVVAAVSASAAEAVALKYSFGPKPVAGFTAVKADDVYNVNRTYGFDLGSKVSFVDRNGAGFVTGENQRPFFFSTRLDPGAYRVDVTLGDPTEETVTTVKSETRRLMLEAVHVPAGQTKRFTFLVHLRSPRIPGGGMVALKAREKEPILYLQWDAKDDSTRTQFIELDWDEKLTLEFGDAHAALSALEITNVEKPTTVYLVGDSTMTDQMMEPWGAWGQMLPRWFKPPVLIANYAESGESARSYFSERRWPKLMSEIHAGDYVLIQFGINDRGTPLDQFKQFFVQFIKDTRDHGATPVLVTSQNLRTNFFDAKGQPQQTLGGFPDAMRDVAKEQNVPLLDLNALSTTLYAAIGAENLPKAFVDGTHQNDYGAYELSKCIVNAIVAAKLPFAEGNLVDDWKAFDPAHPDPLENFHLPPDPQLDPARPGGPGAPGRRGPMAGDPPRTPATPPAASEPTKR